MAITNSVEEIPLGSIEPDPGARSPARRLEDSSPGRSNYHLQATAYHPQYNSAVSNDQRPLLEDDTASAIDTQNRKNLWQRLQIWIAKRKERSHYHGWRMGVLIGCCMAFFVLCCNVTLLLIGATRPGGFDDSGFANLLHGDRERISWYNTALHIGINILSSLLLSGSNYTIQVMSSPTREEIDRAHRQGDWLVIGLTSFRNWKRISKKRVVLCLILSLSSIPLHLFYNAATFKALAQNWYTARGVHRYSSEYEHCATNTSYVNLSNTQWKKDFVTFNTSYDYTELIIVYDEVASKMARTIADNSTVERRDLLGALRPRPHSDISLADHINETDWLSSLPYFNPEDGADIHVAHAFAIRAHTQSRIQLSLYFIVVVIAANLFKLLIMLNILFLDRSKYIVTLGDAVASFLSSPDPTTEGRCLYEDKDIVKQCELSTQASRTQDKNTNSTTNDRRPYSVTNTGWRVRKLSYFTFIRNEQARLMIPFILMIIAISFGFMSDAKGGAWAWGVASSSVLEFTIKPITATNFIAWLANMPQLALSFCYMSLNSFCTAMAGIQEWNNLGAVRKGLRVSDPRGEQRSTYFLQLPYKRAIPLLAVSTGLHWLLSQTFFLVRIDVFDGYIIDTSFSRSACGASGVSFAVFFVVFFGLWILVRVVANQKLVTHLPQASSNSLTISAACHPPKDDVEPHLKLVQWGVVDSSETIEGYRHCSLSSLSVCTPEEGQQYY